MNFTNYYLMFLNQPSSGNSDVFRTNETEYITHKFYSTISEGLWNWQVMASNAKYNTNSSIWSFTVCHPGGLGIPSLSPSSSDYFFIGTVDLSWNVDCKFLNNFFFFKVFVSSFF